MKIVKEWIFKFTEQYAGSMIRPCYEEPEEKEITIKAKTFKEAIKELKRFLLSRKKNAFHSFWIKKGEKWQPLIVNNRGLIDDWVFKFSLNEDTFSIYGK